MRATTRLGRLEHRKKALQVNARSPNGANLDNQEPCSPRFGDPAFARGVRMPKTFAIGVAVLAGAFWLAGCATEDYVNKHVATVQGQVTDVQGKQQSQQAYLGTLDQRTREALERAEAAGKLAEGKFLYSVVLSDDSVKFPLDSSQLSPEAQTRLMDFVQKLKSDNRNVYLEIQGHTDSTGG